MKSKIINYLLKIPFLKRILDIIKTITIPGFNKIPIYDVIIFFLKRFNENELQTRARAIAFSIFLAIFPAIIFLFTLIPYIPIENFQLQVLQLLQEFLPSSTYESAYSTIEDIVSHQRGGLLSFGFLFALFVSAEGILTLMLWFNKSFHGSHQRSIFKQRFIAVGLTIILAIFTFLAIGMIVVSEFTMSFLVKHDLLTNVIQYYLLQVLKWIVVVSLCFCGISLLYFFGPSQRKKLYFVNAGSSLATLLIIITSMGFNFFINNFATYNKVYGSIGTLIIILIWLYLNSLVVLVGYELNVSIDQATSSRIKKVKLAD